MWKSLVCVTLLFVTDVVVGKPDYLFNKEVDGWLKLHAVPATWQQAFLNCRYEGAELASPINAELATALRNVMNQLRMDSPIFLGVNAFAQGVFMSIEGVPLNDLSITWGTYGDGKTPEDCLSLSTDGKTYISSCTLSLPYICYKKRDNTTIFNRCGTFDDDYHYNHATGSCYKFHKQTLTWKTGYKICAAEGGHLVIINDKREADIVLGLMGSADVAHIGLRLWNDKSTWLSIHGEKMEDLFNTWGESLPESSGKYPCGDMWSKGTLDTEFCDDPPNHERPFVCEKDPSTLRFENISGEVYEATTELASEA